MEGEDTPCTCCRTIEAGRGSRSTQGTETSCAVSTVSCVLRELRGLLTASALVCVHAEDKDSPDNTSLGLSDSLKTGIVGGTNDN